MSERSRQASRAEYSIHDRKHTLGIARNSPVKSYGRPAARRALVHHIDGALNDFAIDHRVSIDKDQLVAS